MCPIWQASFLSVISIRLIYFCRRTLKTLSCNYRNKRDCSLKRKCGKKSVIYIALLALLCTPNGKTMSYCSCCETGFEVRYYNHKNCFLTLSKKYQTELSKLVCWLKDESHIPVIQRSIVCKAKPYTSGTMHC